MPPGRPAQPIHFLRWISKILIGQYRLGPRECGVFVEVAAAENHEINVFADVDLEDDAVGASALRAVLDGFAEFRFAEGFGLLGKNFFEMGDHAVFESLFPEGVEHGHLFFADV